MKQAQRCMHQQVKLPLPKGREGKQREGELTETEEDNTKEGPSHNKENLPLDALEKDAAATKCWCMQQRLWNKRSNN